MKIIILLVTLLAGTIAFSQTDAEKLREDIKKLDALHDSLMPKRWTKLRSLPKSLTMLGTLLRKTFTTHSNKLAVPRVVLKVAQPTLAVPTKAT